MGDVSDILGLSLGKQGSSDDPSKILGEKKTLSSKYLKKKKPPGMSREVFDLMAGTIASDGFLPAMQTTKVNLGLKEKRMVSVQGKWNWAPFKSSARGDKHQFFHWTRADSQSADYSYAKFNISLEPLVYTEDEYDSFLLSQHWTKEESDYLMSLCRKFDLRWPIIHDRYSLSPSRNIEDLQYRYYFIVNKIRAFRSKSHSSKFNSPTSATSLQMNTSSTTNFDFNREKFRRFQQEQLFFRTKEEEIEEQQLKEELKQIDLSLKKFKKSQPPPPKPVKIKVESVPLTTDSTSLTSRSSSILLQASDPVSQAFPSLSAFSSSTFPPQPLGDTLKVSTSMAVTVTPPPSSSSAPSSSLETLVCSACLSGEREEDILLCDAVSPSSGGPCGRGYHLTCLSPPLNRPPESEWFCPHCVQSQTTTSTSPSISPAGETTKKRGRQSQQRQHQQQQQKEQQLLRIKEEQEKHKMMNFSFHHVKSEYRQETIEEGSSDPIQSKKRVPPVYKSHETQVYSQQQEPSDPALVLVPRAPPRLMSTRLSLDSTSLSLPTLAIQRMNALLRDLGAPPHPPPTKPICDLFDEVRSSALSLVALHCVMKKKSEELKELKKKILGSIPSPPGLSTDFSSTSSSSSSINQAPVSELTLNDSDMLLLSWGEGGDDDLGFDFSSAAELSDPLALSSRSSSSSSSSYMPHDPNDPSFPSDSPSTDALSTSASPEEKKPRSRAGGSSNADGGGRKRTGGGEKRGSRGAGEKSVDETGSAGNQTESTTPGDEADNSQKKKPVKRRSTSNTASNSPPEGQEMNIPRDDEGVEGCEEEPSPSPSTQKAPVRKRNKKEPSGTPEASSSTPNPRNRNTGTGARGSGGPRGGGSTNRGARGRSSTSPNEEAAHQAQHPSLPTNAGGLGLGFEMGLSFGSLDDTQDLGNYEFE